jgi:hypothetical protein
VRHRSVGLEGRGSGGVCDARRKDKQDREQGRSYRYVVESTRGHGGMVVEGEE